MELPKLESEGPAKYGFGWDEKSGAYKVFALSTLDEIFNGNVYSSKTNSWKAVEHWCVGMYDINGVFSSGKIHWLAILEDYIEYFDLESEKFGRIELPFEPSPECRHLHYALAESGGCLHLLCVYNHDGDGDDDQQSYVVVWVMKESGWSKLITLPIDFELVFSALNPLFLGGPDGEIVIMFHGDHLVYRPKNVDVLRTTSAFISAMSTLKV